MKKEETRQVLEKMKNLSMILTEEIQEILETKRLEEISIEGLDQVLNYFNQIKDQAVNIKSYISIES